MTGGCFYGVGVGPGDPELITLKAMRLMMRADVICYLANQEGHSIARAIVQEYLASAGGQVEYPIHMPMAINRDQAIDIYDSSAEVISTLLEEGKTVIFLCEGDPLFFGSFAYLLERLSDRYHCQSVPGICSINAAAAALKTPLTQLAESLAVISSRQNDQQILDTLSIHDSVVILKVGASRERLRYLITLSGRLDDAQYIEHATGEKEHIVNDINELNADRGPYFSLFLLTRQRVSA